jgi:hypothetical protein
MSKFNHPIPKYDVLTEKSRQRNGHPCLFYGG